MDESVEAGPSVHDNPVDIEQIRLEAKNQWSSRSQICKILQNYEKFGITSKLPNKPPSGSLFLFDKNVQRHFRKDGHNWTKKKEGHRKFKAGSFGVLNCYYTHGEENRNFQRRCYWMLKGDFSHIVFVQYLDVTGKMEDSICVKETQGAGPYSQGTKDSMPNSEIDGSMHSSSHLRNCHITDNTDMALLNCAQALEHEKSVDIEYNHQPSSGLHSGLELRQPAVENIDAGGSDPHVPLFSSNSFHEEFSAIPRIDSAPTQSDQGKSDDDADWLTYLDFDISDSYTPCRESVEHRSSSSSSHPDTIDKFLSNSFARRLDFGVHSQICEESAGKMEDSSRVKETQGAGPYYQQTKDIMPNSEIDGSMHSSSHLSNCHVTDNTDTMLLNCAQALEHEKSVDIEYNHQPSSRLHSGLELQQPAVENIDSGGSDSYVPLVSPNHEILPDIPGVGLSLAQLDKGKSAHDLLTNIASQSREDILDICTGSIQGMALVSSSHPDIRNDNSMENGFQTLRSNEEHDYALPPDSDGCFNLWGKSRYASVIEHLFDVSLTEEGSKKWSSSGANGETGENENENDVSSIPSEGKLDIQDIYAAENYSDSAGAKLLQRFDNLLWSGSSATNSVTSSLEDASQLSSKISSLLKGDNKELDQMLKSGLGIEFSSEKFKDQLLQELLKEKLCLWILPKDAEGGNGPGILDEVGQEVLHLAAVLGYDWALKPTILAGVNVDLRDVNGWTAHHWAASCSRAQAVASLISLGAAPRALTVRSPKYPASRTPTDLASVNGHKGIAGYLADRSSDVNIPSINLGHQDDSAGPKAVLKISDITAAPVSLGNASGRASRKKIADRGYRLLQKLRLRELEQARLNAEKRERSRRREELERETEELERETEEWERQKEEEERQKAAMRKDEGPDDEGPDDEGPDDEGQDGEGPEKDMGPEKDQGPEKKKKEGKKRAPDPALESEKASKISKAYLASMALLTAYYNVQSMKTIQMLVLVFDEASKKPGERKVSYIDNGFELSAIRV